MKKVIVIVGATGSGKTKLAIDLANKFNGEIINADAFQIYKEIGIGTAKASEEELKQAKFHLNGTLSIYKP
jgi:tRNA dimethylallyltransferase